MKTTIAGLLALLTLGACAGGPQDRTAALPTSTDDSPAAVGASGRRPPRPVITNIVRQKRHAELYGTILSGSGQPLCGAQYCVGAQAAGACGPTVRLDCSCLGELYAEVGTGAATGDCTVTIRVRDQQGVEGTGSFTFPVGD